MYRCFKFLQIRIYLLLFYKPMCLFFVRIHIVFAKSMRLCVGCTDFYMFVYNFAQCMRLCVGCTAFAYVQLCAMYVALRKLYGFCVRMCTTLRNLCGLAQFVRLLRVKRLVRMYTSLRRLYGFFDLSGLWVCIQLLRVKRLVHTYTSFVY